MHRGEKKREEGREKKWGRGNYSRIRFNGGGCQPVAPIGMAARTKKHELGFNLFARSSPRSLSTAIRPCGDRERGEEGGGERESPCPAGFEAPLFLFSTKRLERKGGEIGNPRGPYTSGPLLPCGAEGERKTRSESGFPRLLLLILGRGEEERKKGRGGPLIARSALPAVTVSVLSKGEKPGLGEKWEGEESVRSTSQLFSSVVELRHFPFGGGGGDGSLSTRHESVLLKGKKREKTEQARPVASRAEKGVPCSSGGKEGKRGGKEGGRWC